MASKPAAAVTKRTTTAAATVKPSETKIHSLAIVADKAQVSGPHRVEVAEGSILQPYARIRAERGDVRIGKHCTVAETAVVGVFSPGSESGVEAEAEAKEEQEGNQCVLADHVSIEAGASVEAVSVGEYSVIDVHARVRPGAVVGKWCTISAKCELREGEVVPDYTMVFGDGSRRKTSAVKKGTEVREARVRGRAKEMELLGSLIVDSGKWR